MNRMYPKVTISEEGEKWLNNGQMWMYRNNVVHLDESIENGALVDIVTTNDRYLGTGFLSKNSMQNNPAVTVDIAATTKPYAMDVPTSSPMTAATARGAGVGAT